MWGVNCGRERHPELHTNHRHRSQLECHAVLEKVPRMASVPCAGPVVFASFCFSILSLDPQSNGNASQCRECLLGDYSVD